MIEVNERISANLTGSSRINASHASVTRSSHKSSDEIYKKINQVENKVDVSAAEVAFSKLQNRNNGLQEVAMTIRSAESAMQEIGGHLGEMKEALNTIEKQYPPFHNQSSERVEFLNHFSMLRKQIDKLTNGSGSDQIAAPVLAETKGPDFKEFGVAVEGHQFTLRKHETHSGQNGLNIASLSNHASDAEVRSASRGLDIASQKLQRRQAGLAHDAVKIQQEIAVVPEKINDDNALEKKSLDISSTLSELPSVNLTSEKTSGALGALE